jgi:NADH:ubiquinone oxidoreductase subunit 4 (subunit M)
MILVGLFSTSSTLFILSSLPLILTLIYSLFLYNRVFFGPVYTTFIRYYSDSTVLETVILIILVCISLIGAFCPMLIFSIIN